MQLGFKAFVADRRPSEMRPDWPTAARSVDQGTPGYVATVTPGVQWAKIMTAALVVIAGVLAFDFLVLWISAGRLIERLPF